MQLEIPRHFQPMVNQARQVASSIFRPISRYYDAHEHKQPKELDMLASILDGMNDGLGDTGAGAGRMSRGANKDDTTVRNGNNMRTTLGLMELCWGDVGLALSLPRQGLGNAAIAAVANDEQLEKLNGCWAAMAITEPGAGSDSASIRTTATADGDEYVINGEKIYVTAGDRADVIVVWATLDRSRGKAAIKSFYVKKGTPGMTVERLEKKLGIKASDTAAIRFDNCRVPKENMLGDPDIKADKGFAGAMQTFDNTRPLVAGMAVGLGQAALERTRELLSEAGVDLSHQYQSWLQPAAVKELHLLEAELEAARLLTIKAAWMADNSQPNSREASMAKAKAGRVCTRITLSCVSLCSSLGYGEKELLEKWARDAKILDIFEGTQQIQLLIIARRLLNKSSSELR
ncbi:MAG: acyl-CoA dehydrogenase [Halomonadaceae bacterium]|nr:MAG: acyl-CoA dehydrogenase [Halomonadaceae bacterium]